MHIDVSGCDLMPAFDHITLFCMQVKMTLGIVRLTSCIVHTMHSSTIRSITIATENLAAKLSNEHVYARTYTPELCLCHGDPLSGEFD